MYAGPMFLSAGTPAAWVGLGMRLFLESANQEKPGVMTPQDFSAGNAFPRSSAVAYQPPAVLTATIYSNDPGTNKALFTYKRSVAIAGPASIVLAEYAYPDGKLAVRERVSYQDHLLARYELDELQTGASGSATIERDAREPNRAKIVFRYARAVSSHAAPATRTEPLLPDTLVNDMVGPFLASHWDRLNRGEKVACRCIVVARRETIGFTFRKESEGRWRGRDVVMLKMEPSNLLVSVFVDPLRFVVEKDPPHRVLQYAGRTVPKTGQHGQWTDLDAMMVFNW